MAREEGAVSWQLDRARSTIEFSVQAFAVSTVNGHFEAFEAEIAIDPDQPARSRVRATIDAASLTTGNGVRDAHLRSADFLDVARFPTITFESHHVAHTSMGDLRVRGVLSIHGMTKDVELEGVFRGPFQDASGLTAVDLTLVIAADPREFLEDADHRLNPFVGHTVLITITARLERVPPEGTPQAS